MRARGFARYRSTWTPRESEHLAHLEPEAVLEGEIRDAKGNVPVGVSVDLRPLWNSIAVSVDPRTGAFRATELAAGEYTVSARDGGGRQMATQRIALESGQAVKLHIKVPKGEIDN